MAVSCTHHSSLITHHSSHYSSLITLRTLLVTHHSPLTTYHYHSSRRSPQSLITHYTSSLFTTHSSSLTHHDCVQGLRELYAGFVRNWDDRIQSLANAGLWQEALSLALDFYLGKAKAVVGLPMDSKQKTITADKIVELVDSYAKHVLNGKDLDQNKVKVLAGLCIDYLNAIKKYTQFIHHATHSSLMPFPSV